LADEIVDGAKVSGDYTNDKNVVDIHDFVLIEGERHIKLEGSLGLCKGSHNIDITKQKLP